MEFHPRRLLPETKFLVVPCSPLVRTRPRPRPPPPPPPPPSPQPPLHSHEKTLNQQTQFLFILVVVALVSFGIAYALIAKWYFKRMAEIRRRRRRNLNPPVLFDTGDEASEDEDRGPVDHHIWYINTIGLPQSIIDSIAVFKYTREEGLIDGTECSVCLNEFSEDESLRLLPKCSHAFHLPCIDTWLRSHKNCPLCRAPVLRGSRSRDDHVIEESNVNVSVPQENTSGDSIREGSSPSSNPVDTPSDSGAIRESLKKDLKHKNSKSCELVGNELLEKRVAMEGEIQMQPIRRSASMSGPIGRFMNQRIMDNIVLMKNSKATSSADGNRNRGSSSVHRSTRSYSFGPSLQKGPVSMKRSSSSGKIWSSKTVEKTQYTGFTVV